MYDIHYIFYNRYNLDSDIIDRPNGSGDYLFLHFLEPMKIRMGGKTIQTKENAFFIFDKGTPQYYYAVKKFCNSFIHFDTDVNFSKKYNIPLNTVLYLPELEEITSKLKELHLEFFLKKACFEEKIDADMTNLFIPLSRRINSDTLSSDKTTYLYNIFQSARMEILSKPESPWTSESMAALTNLGTSQFYNYYKTYFNSTPKADLINARLSLAQNLLLTEKLTVTEAALRSGFQTPSHFMRYFKKKYNSSPQKWVNEKNRKS